MSTNERSVGILPVDLVLRYVLLDGLRELRLYPAIVDQIFRPLLEDDTSAGVYGQDELRQAREWFQNTDVPVRIADGLEPPTATCLTVKVADGQEDALTLADVHYEPVVEDIAAPWPVLAGPFDPVQYDVATGLLTLPDAVALVVVPGMIVVDRAGRELPVVSVPDTHVVGLGEGTPADLQGMTLRAAHPHTFQALESLLESNTYQVGVHVHGEPVYLAYLFALVKYVLYRGREILESRGMEQVRYAWTGPERDSALGEVENLYSRYFTVTAISRSTWAKRSGVRLTDVQVTVRHGTPAPADPFAVDLNADVLGG